MTLNPSTPFAQFSGYGGDKTQHHQTNYLILQGVTAQLLKRIPVHFAQNVEHLIPKLFLTSQRA